MTNRCARLQALYSSVFRSATASSKDLSTLPSQASVLTYVIPLWSVKLLIRHLRAFYLAVHVIESSLALFPYFILMLLVLICLIVVLSSYRKNL